MITIDPKGNPAATEEATHCHVWACVGKEGEGFLLHSTLAVHGMLWKQGSVRTGRWRGQLIRTRHGEADVLWTASVPRIHPPFCSAARWCPRAILECFQCVAFEVQTFPFPFLLQRCGATEGKNRPFHYYYRMDYFVIQKKGFPIFLYLFIWWPEQQKI